MTAFCQPILCLDENKIIRGLSLTYTRYDMICSAKGSFPPSVHRLKPLRALLSLPEWVTEEGGGSNLSISGRFFSITHITKVVKKRSLSSSWVGNEYLNKRQLLIDTKSTEWAGYIVNLPHWFWVQCIMVGEGHLTFIGMEIMLLIQFSLCFQAIYAYKIDF